MGLLTPVAIRLGSLDWLPKFLPQITRVDRTLSQLTGGRLTLVRLAGLPSLELTVVGRRSGVPRTTPVLCVPYQETFLVAGSNFGGPKVPVWVFNVRAADTVQLAALAVVPKPSETSGSSAWVE